MHRYLNFTTRSVVWFLRSNQDGELHFHAPFQRNPVWALKQKSALIETILLEYPIPELYMQSIVSTEGLEQHVVVDGQQRLRSIIEFAAGSFALAEDAERGAGCRFEELNGEDKKRFFEYVFVSRQLPEMPEEELRSIFQRINRNTVTLNAQELRHATYFGTFITKVEEIADIAQWDETGVFSANDRKRMLDAEFVSELVVAYLHGPQNKKNSLEKFYRAYEGEFPKQDEVVSTFLRVLDELIRVLPDLRRTRWRKKSDFYSLFTVFARHASSLPLSSDDRVKAGNTLTSFASEVDAKLGNYLVSSAEDDETGEPIDPAGEDAITRYAIAVSRAASDLANRKARDEALDSILTPFLRKPSAPPVGSATP